jgi:hypothetical protein
VAPAERFANRLWSSPPLGGTRNRNSDSEYILDFGPKAGDLGGANMLVMNPPRIGSNESSSRRFLLLPEEHTQGSAQRPAIKRYRLAGIGRRSDLDGTDLATARIAGEFGRLRRPYG